MLGYKKRNADILIVEKSEAVGVVLIYQPKAKENDRSWTTKSKDDNTNQALLSLDIVEELGNKDAFSPYFGRYAYPVAFLL